MNPWLTHVNKYRAAHPELSYKQVLKAAGASYKKRTVRKRGRRQRRRMAGSGMSKSAALAALRNKSMQAFFIKHLGNNMFKKLLMAFGLNGDGLGNVITSARKFANTNPRSRDPFPGELHAIEMTGKYIGSSYNFLGPKTQLVKRLKRGDIGINDADAAARVHDMDYHKMHELSGDALRKAVIRADMKLIKRLIRSFRLPEVKIAAVAMTIKLIGQRLSIIKWNKFVNSWAEPNIRTSAYNHID